MADKKNFIGRCKKIGNWATGIGLSKDSCVFDERGWLNIVVVHNADNPDKKPYAYIDDWKPNSARAEEKAEQERQGFQPNDSIEPDKKDELPF